MISFAYDPQRDKKYMKEFLETLPYILPCKFCRSSLTQYYKELPFELDSRESFSLWFYRIHGKVNQKLRSQGQQIPPDPPFSTVKSIYTERLQYFLEMSNNNEGKITVAWEKIKVDLPFKLKS